MTKIFFLEFHYIPHSETFFKHQLQIQMIYAILCHIPTFLCSAVFNKPDTCKNSHQARLLIKVGNMQTKIKPVQELVMYISHTLHKKSFNSFTK